LGFTPHSKKATLTRLRQPGFFLLQKRRHTMAMITTTKTSDENPDGLMDTELPNLHKRVIITEDENELSTVIEYWLGPEDEVVSDTELARLDELVHRSAHVELKKFVAALGDAASF
jgi:hypothetical protein